MGGVAGFGGFARFGVDHEEERERSAALDALYGPDWRERALKTLDQELRERGIEPRSGDDGYQVVPMPRLIGDRISLAMICSLIAFLGFCACWAWWEYLP